MANYMSAWKTFRRLGDEPSATAEHITSQPGWPVKGGLCILDIGCGDGRMLEAFLLKAPRTIKELILLDPEEWLLSEAASELQSLGLGASIRPVVGVADKEALELATEADVALAIHLVYLLAHNRFRALVDHWPAGVPLFVVLDAPDSVFSELWSHTAPDYATRSTAVHELLSSDVSGNLGIRRTDFSTHVASPFALHDSIRELVLSLLCYCEYRELEEAKKAMVESSIRKRLVGGRLRCECSCYEILRMS